MLAHGDIEAVNLGAGDRQRRVVGNGESRLEILGIRLKPIDPAALADYEQAMDEAIPEIVKSVGARKRLASEARQRVL